MTRDEAIGLIGSAEALDECRARWASRMSVPMAEVPNNVIFLSEKPPSERDMASARAWAAAHGRPA